MVNHSPSLSLFSRCVNCFSMPAYQLSVILVTLYVKALLSRQTVMASPNMISSSWGVGKVTQLTFTSTNVNNLIIFKKFSTSIHNSSPLSLTNSLAQRLHTLLLPSFSYYATIMWPVETCREISLIQSGDSPRMDSLHKKPLILRFR